MEREGWLAAKDLFQEIMCLQAKHTFYTIYADNYPFLFESVKYELDSAKVNGVVILSDFMYQQAISLGETRGRLLANKAFEDARIFEQYDQAEADLRELLRYDPEM